MSSPASINTAQDCASGSSHTPSGTSTNSSPTMTEGSTLNSTSLSSERGEVELSQDPSESTETSPMLNNWLYATDADNVTISEILCAEYQLELDN